MPACVEELVSSLGQPGKYQVLVCFLLCLNSFFFVFNHLSMTFFGAEPSYVKCDLNNNIDNNMSWKNSTEVIFPSDGNAINSTDSCQLFKFTGDRDLWCPVRDNCSSCSDISPYITEDGEWTIVSEFGLVCDRQYLISLVSSIYNVGYMLGSIIFGQVADSVGRLPTIIVTLYLSVAVGIGIFFAKTFHLFVILKFTIGLLSQGVQIATVTLVMESISSKYHPTAVYVTILFWGFANVGLALIAYLVRHWRWMQLWSSGLTLISLVYIWLLPESLRWLITQQKFDRAEKQAVKIIEYNRKKELLTEMKGILLKCKQTISSSSDKRLGIKHLFLHKIILYRTIILGFIWLTLGMAYYGLVLNTGALYGSKYVNYFIGSGVEIVAFSVSFVLPNTVGRRRPFFVYLILGGVTCIIAGNTPDTYGSIKTGFSLAGRFFLSGAFSLIFLFTGELYPTTIRAVGFGWCSLWNGVGAIVAPQINLLGSLTYQSLPTTLFGCLSVVASSLVLILPETAMQVTPDTLEEAESFGWGCCKEKKSENITQPDVIDLDKF